MYMAANVWGAVGLKTTYTSMLAQGSMFSKGVNVYGVPFVSKLLRLQCLAQGSMFSKGVDV